MLNFGKGLLRVRNQDNGEPEILIYGLIGSDPWGEGGVTDAQVAAALAEIDAPRINVRINSVGGEAFQGFAIYNALVRNGAEIVTHVDGLAASAAATVAMAGNQIKMAENAFLMIHRSWGLVIGDTGEMEKAANELDKLDGSIARTFANRTGKSEAKILEMMQAETWLDSDEAFDQGFVDEITEKGKPAQAQNRFDLSRFTNVPEGVARLEATPPVAPPAGLTMSQEFESLGAALTAVEGFAARVKSLTDLRQGQDRTPLSNENRGRLEDLQATVVNIQAGIRDLLALTTTTADADVMANLLAEFARTQFELNQLTMEG